MVGEGRRVGLQYVNIFTKKLNKNIFISFFFVFGRRGLD